MTYYFREIPQRFSLEFAVLSPKGTIRTGTKVLAHPPNKYINKYTAFKYFMFLAGYQVLN